MNQFWNRKSNGMFKVDWANPSLTNYCLVPPRYAASGGIEPIHHDLEPRELLKG
jgi:hypothetical protein